MKIIIKIKVPAEPTDEAQFDYGFESSATNFSYTIEKAPENTALRDDKHTMVVNVDVAIDKESDFLSRLGQYINAGLSKKMEHRNKFLSPEFTDAALTDISTTISNRFHKFKATYSSSTEIKPGDTKTTTSSYGTFNKLFSLAGEEKQSEQKQDTPIHAQTDITPEKIISLLDANSTDTGYYDPSIMKRAILETHIAITSTQQEILAFQKAILQLENRCLYLKNSPKQLGRHTKSTLLLCAHSAKNALQSLLIAAESQLAALKTAKTYFLSRHPEPAELQQTLLSLPQSESFTPPKVVTELLSLHTQLPENYRTTTHETMHNIVSQILENQWIDYTDDLAYQIELRKRFIQLAMTRIAGENSPDKLLKKDLNDLRQEELRITSRIISLDQYCTHVLKSKRLLDKKESKHTVLTTDDLEKMHENSKSTIEYLQKIYTGCETIISTLKSRELLVKMSIDTTEAAADSIANYYIPLFEQIKNAVNEIIVAHVTTIFTIQKQQERLTGELIYKKDDKKPLTLTNPPLTIILDEKKYEIKSSLRETKKRASSEEEKIALAYAYRIAAAALQDALKYEHPLAYAATIFPEINFLLYAGNCSPQIRKLPEAIKEIFLDLITNTSIERDDSHYSTEIEKVSEEILLEMQKTQLRLTDSTVDSEMGCIIFDKTAKPPAEVEEDKLNQWRSDILPTQVAPHSFQELLNIIKSPFPRAPRLPVKPSFFHSFSSSSDPTLPASELGEWPEEAKEIKTKRPNFGG